MSRRPELAPINPPDRPLQSGGGGGTFDGMEARVAALETHVGYIRRDIGELKADMSEIRRDISVLRSDFSSATGSLRGDLSNEIGSLRSGLSNDIGTLRSDFSSKISTLRNDFRGEIEGLKIAQATLTERVNHLPSKGFIVSATLSSLAVITALIVFQDHIKAIFAH